MIFCFNSTLVRLQPVYNCYDGIRGSFQFHTGSITASIREEVIKATAEFQFHTGSITAGTSQYNVSL